MFLVLYSELHNLSKVYVKMKQDLTRQKVTCLNGYVHPQQTYWQF